MRSTGATRARRLGGVRFLLMLLLLAAATACGAPDVFDASDAVDAFVDAGLEAPNPRDVTADKCTTVECVEAVETDVVTVYRWPDTGAAHLHSNRLQQPAYALNEFVLVFPIDTDAQTNEYAEALEQAIGSAE